MAFENDRIFLQSALPDLQGYILSKDLYWPLSLPPRAPRSIQIPQLTIGNLLLSQARLSALRLEAGQQEELADFTQRIAQVREEWRSNWSKKAAREYTSRLNRWGQYIRELRGSGTPRSGGASSYASQVRNRAILRLLIGEILEGIPQNEVEQTNLLDEILRGLSETSRFVWEPEVERAFPWDGFWFLYVEFRK